MKQCITCNELKSIENYYKSKERKDGYLNTCKTCKQAQMKKYRDQNRDRINKAGREKYHSDPKRREAIRLRQRSEAYKSKRRESQSSLSEERREAKRRYRREYEKQHKDQKNARRAKRRANQLQRTPTYANLELIKKFYKLAKDLEKETGVKYHVDHIIPLQGKTVSGFHIETNLQVIPATDNMAKSNKIDSEYGICGRCPTADYT